jgi:hypothetical protein
MHGGSITKNLQNRPLRDDDVRLITNDCLRWGPLAVGIEKTFRPKLPGCVMLVRVTAAAFRGTIVRMAGKAEAALRLLPVGAK